MRALLPAHFVRSALVSLVICAAAAGCGGNGGMQQMSVDGACPMDSPATCPDPAPSYANQVNAIIQTYCATSSCHSPTGVEAALSFATYDDIHNNTGRSLDMFQQLRACRMPLPPAPTPPEAERVALLGWLLCGAPNN